MAAGVNNDSDLSLSDSSDFSDDDIPLAVLVNQRRLADLTEIESDSDPVVQTKVGVVGTRNLSECQFEGVPGPVYVLEEGKDESDFFKLLFPNSLFSDEAKETTHYAA